MKNILNNSRSNTVSMHINIKCDHRTTRKEIKQKYAEEFAILRSRLTGLARFSSILDKYVEQLELERKLEFYSLADIASLNKKSEKSYQDLLLSNAQILIITLNSVINSGITKVPASAADFAPITSAINIIENKLPNITETDLNTLYQLSIQTKPVFAKYFTSAQQLVFWQNISTGYNKINQNITNSQSTINNELNQTDQEIVALQLALGMFHNITNSSEEEFFNISEENIADAVYNSRQITQEFLNLLSEVDLLSTEQQTLVNTSITNWLQLPLGDVSTEFSGHLMADFCGSTLAATKTLMFLSKNGPSSATDIKNFLLNTLISQLNINPVTQPIIDFLIRLCGDTFVFNSMFLQENGLYATLNPEYESTFLKNSSINPNYRDLILTVDFQFERQAEPILEQLKLNKQTLDNEYVLLTTSQTAFYEEYRQVQANINAILNLGKAFIKLVLNTYLPNQQKMLQPYINLINYNNIGASTINNLLSTASDFNNASIYYNFSSFLVQSDQGADIFSGSYSQLTLALSQEKQKIQNDLTKLNSLTNTVKTNLTEINNNTSLSDTQKKDITSKLQNYLKMFSTAQQQLVSLQQELNQVTITLVNNNANYVKITGPKDWQSTLSGLEQDVVNGSSSTTPSGGLVPIFTQIESDQQSYTNQGETQQLNLQTQMTTIQQEWTIIATSLQILNQTIIMLASNVYK